MESKEQSHSSIQNKWEWFRQPWFGSDDQTLRSLPPLDLVAYLCMLDPMEEYKLRQFQKDDPKTLESLEQKSEEWIRAREGRLTGSNAYKYVGQDPRASRFENLKSFVLTKSSSSKSEHAAMKWGSEQEVSACRQYEQKQREAWNKAYQRFRKKHPTAKSMIYRGVEISLGSDDPVPELKVETKGMLLDLDCPWRGISIDGVVWIGNQVVWVVEFKCPYANGNHTLYPFIPLSYVWQCQSNLYICRKRYPKVNFIDFYVYSPHGYSRVQINWNEQRWINYWNEELKFYFLMYLPALCYPYAFEEAVQERKEQLALQKQQLAGTKRTMSITSSRSRPSKRFKPFATENEKDEEKNDLDAPPSPTSRTVVWIEEEADNLHSLKLKQQLARLPTLSKTRY